MYKFQMIVKRLIRNATPRPLVIRMSSSRVKDEGTKSKLPRNELDQWTSATTQPENGAIYDTKPFKITLDANKRYNWCACGKSKTQPLCDGTHRSIFLKITMKPVQFQVKETKAYWLCNCKQTKTRPFCDGTHKDEAIQGTVK